MHCLLCLFAHEESQPAMAICQHCGAAVCQHHLFVIKRHVPIAGMAVTNAARSFICADCHQMMYAKKGQPAREPSAQKNGSLGQLWKRLSHRHADDKEEALPEPAEAVAMIERFLQTRR